MNALLKKVHQEVRAKVRAFAEEKIKPVIGEFEALEQFPADLIKSMHSLNIFGMQAPVEYGGQGSDYLSFIIAVEELARIDSSVAATLAAHNSLGVGPILEFGSEEQKKKYLPDLCTAQNLWAFGLTEENAGSDAQGVETIAEEKTGGWVVNGHKKYITNAASDMASGISFVSQTGMRPDGKKEFTAFLVSKGTPGYTREFMKQKFLWRAADNGMVYLKDCHIPAEDQLGERGQGIKIMLKTIDSGRLSIAAMGLGLAQGAYEMAVSFAKKRKQFGKAISEFQTVAFRLADMAMKIETARTFLYHACWLKDNGEPFGTQSAMAKLYCSQVASDVASEALQIFGGAGFFRNDEYPIERFFRDQRLLSIGEGTSEVLRMVISRDVLK
ncbi:acyl-CoA dehydrogenase family protein [Gaoshiqia sediminis]|uniref:Acyl-CoA dehydrogenase family protein n=1 Tax=Gaoshiqia sediminis TaxID=2986998 RepID=A0AA42C9R1_9BACT|nr:acyl-CoA dehydrogenase family protein [Gaoshiqia sediminis]MCW0482465.1 acyl-CoA dehydrogenase family protein [Gaoshiqia sediminis]